MNAGVIGIFDSVDLPIVVISANCRAIKFNRAAAAVLRLLPSDIGRFSHEIFSGIDHLDEICAKVIADGTPCRIETRDGDRCFLVRIAPHKDDLGGTGAVLTFTNVTAFRASLDQAIYEREHTKAILNTVIEPLVVLDSALRVQTANRAFYSMFGLSRDETQRALLCDLGDGHWKTSAVWELLKSTLSQNTDVEPVEIVRDFPFIGRRTVLLDARRLSQGSDTMLLVRLQDVTEQKRARETILQRTAQFQTLLSEAPLGVYLVDSDLRIREVNPTAHRAFRDLADLIGRDFDEVIHILWSKNFADELVEKFRHTLVTGEPHAVAEQIEERRDLGVLECYEWQISRIPLPEGGHGVVCYFRDISSLVKARKEVEESERQLRKLAETIPQLVWTSLPDGNFDYLSAQWVAYTGVSEADQLGLQWLDRAAHPDDRQRIYDAWIAAVRDREPYDVECRLKRFDGAYRCFRTRGAPLRNTEGTVEKWFGTCTDIEDQKVAERHMLDLQKRESLGLLAGGVAHDFNNLLVGVLGNASMIEETLEQWHPLRPLVKSIIEAAERATYLTRQMLAYAGKGRIFLERVDVNALVRSTASLVKASFPKSVRLVLNIDEPVLIVEADSGQIQQVVMNLAINGAEAVGEEQSGSVYIGTSVVELNHAFLREHTFIGDAPREGVYVCIEVRDTGAGIERDTLARIFDPFFTTKFTGRGLGLAAVRGIVQSAHGALEVISLVGHGATFRVLLPALEGAPPLIEAAPKDQAVEKASRLPAILVIDDEEIVRHTSRAMLTQAGYSVLLAEGGQQGLDIFAAPPAEIALIILDMSMPGLSSKDTLTLLRMRNDRVPVLIFSGFSEEHVHQYFEGLKISGFVQKPFTRSRIISAVREALELAIALPNTKDRPEGCLRDDARH